MPGTAAQPATPNPATPAAGAPIQPPSTTETLTRARAAIVAEVKAGRLPPSAVEPVRAVEQWDPAAAEPTGEPAAKVAPVVEVAGTPAAPPVVEPAAVTPEERAGFRAEKRKWREKFDGERRAWEAETAKVRADLVGLIKARDAAAAGDYESAMREAFSLSVSDLNKRLIEKHSGKDPRVERLEQEAKALRERVEARDAADAKARAESEHAAAEREWSAGVSKDLAGDPALAPFAANQHFLAQIVEVQRSHWDGEETITAREAAAEVIAALDTPESRGIYDLLHHVFGDRDATHPEARGSAGANRSGSASAKRPKTVSTSRAAEVAPGGPGEFSHAEWKARWSGRLGGSEPG